MITITSGKGGVGKTTASVNLAIALATRGNKVCLFDADTGLANVNILLGLEPQYTLAHLLSGEKNIKEILTPGPRGLQIIPAASGIAEFADLNQRQRRILTANLKALEKHFDYLIIDTAAGIDNTVQQFVRAAHCSIVVVSSEPTSLTDAFALLRVIKSKGDPGPVYAMINRVEDYAESAEIYKRFASAVRKFIKITPKYIGYVADDPEIRKSIISQQPIIISRPHSPGSRCLFTLANGVEKHFKASPISNSFADFWQEQEAQIKPVPDVTPTASTRPRQTLADADSAATHGTSRAAAPGQPHPDWGDLVDVLNRQLMTTQLSDHQVAHSIEILINQYRQRFGKLPFSIEEMLWHELDADELPRERMRSLVQTIESKYQERYKQSMRNSIDEMIHFLSNNEAEEAQYVQLAQLLNRGFHRRFRKNLFEEISSVAQSRPRLYPVRKRR